MTLEEFTKLFVPTIEDINVLIYLTLFVRKWRFPKKTVVWACISVILLLLPYNAWFTWKFGDSREVLYTFTPLCHLTLILLVLFLGKMEQGRLLFSITASYMLIFLCSALSRPFEVGSYYFQSIVRLIFFVAFVIINYRFHRPLLMDAMAWIDKGWYMLSLLPLSLIPYYAHTYRNRELDTVFYLLLAEGILFYSLLLWLFSLLRRQHQMDYERTLLETHVSAIRLQCGQLENINQKMRVIRHDIRHYCQLMENALSVQDTAQAINILEKIKEKASATQLDADDDFGFTSGGGKDASSVNALITYYRHVAEKQGICMKVSLSLPEMPEFDMVEFCVLISNGIENAINACLKIPKTEKRKIVVSGMMRHTQYFFEIKNTYMETVHFDESHRPVSPKDGHGYGVQSMCGFAAKYNAFLDFQTDETWFRLRFLI